MGPVRIMVGDVLEQLTLLPESSVHCVVTSPPYWALRDYGVEGQLGRERTPEEYVARMVEVFREVRRVLRPDGTLWLNIGDTYANDPPGKGDPGPRLEGSANVRVPGQVKKWRSNDPGGIKKKDLIGIPWMLAFALRGDGWHLRSDVIWAKRNPMPSSVPDRPSTAHEYVFLLGKSDRYFYDVEGSSEPVSGTAYARGNGINPKSIGAMGKGSRSNDSMSGAINGLVERRRMRSVWSLSSEPFKGAHFATFPTKLVAKCLKAGISIDGVSGNEHEGQTACGLGSRARGARIDPSEGAGLGSGAEPVPAAVGFGGREPGSVPAHHPDGDGRLAADL